LPESRSKSKGEQILKGFISALQFITSIPVGGNVIFSPRAMIPFFPVVGLLLGVIVAAFDFVAILLWPTPVVAVLDAAFFALLTGALHLDGLGDSADGLYGSKSRDRALEIMKDSRIGAMGLVAIVFCLAVKWGGLTSLEAHRSLLIILVPSFSRASMIFGMYFLKYGRPEGGTGSPFFKEPLDKKVFFYLVIPVILSLFAGFRGLVLIGTFVIITTATILFYKKKIGCITGDMLGAMTETSEAALFLIVSIGNV
jgi:adenosylcobinamide-GDP ribazoletransferase